MPSPVGHTLSGWIAYLVLTGRRKRSLWLFLSFVLLSNLPDFDFFPGWMLGQPNLFHRGASHSLLLAMVIGVSAGVIFKIAGGKFVPVAVATFLVYTVHISLDLFSADYGTPQGFQILWPFSDRYYIAPSVIFTNITRSPMVEEFVPSLFNSHNLRAVINEVIIFLPPLLLLLGLKGRGITTDRSLNRAENASEIEGDGVKKNLNHTKP